jgi:hypothetical protein
VAEEEEEEEDEEDDGRLCLLLFLCDLNLALSSSEEDEEEDSLALRLAFLDFLARFLPFLTSVRFLLPSPSSLPDVDSSDLSASPSLPTLSPPPSPLSFSLLSLDVGSNCPSTMRSSLLSYLGSLGGGGVDTFLFFFPFTSRLVFSAWATLDALVGAIGKEWEEKGSKITTDQSDICIFMRRNKSM